MSILVNKYQILLRMNNLDIFRKQTELFISSAEIKSIEQWKQLLQFLCDKKVFSAKQVKLLNQNVEKRSFPIKVEQFEEIIMKQFAEEPTKRLMADIQKIQKQIKEVKGVLAVWKQKGLSKAEKRALEIIFAKGNSRMKQICHTLAQKKQLLQSISEPEVQLIRAMDEWTVMQKVKQKYKDYEQFQQINGRAIQNLFSQIRVKQVHFRTKKMSKSSDENIIVTTAFNSKNDEEVEVTKIPKRLNDFDIINKNLVTFNALRDLMLSPYFLRFLGYNTNADPNYYFYFRQYVQTKNLEKIVLNSSVSLSESYPIFRYWTGQIFRGFCDIYYQSTYEPILPIKLRDLEITDYGLKLIFKHVKFSAVRDVERSIEGLLLENLGKIILQLLKISQKQIEDKLQNVENKSLIYSLLKARQGKKKFDQKKVGCYLNFFNVQTHPLFQSVQETQGLEIIDNFTILYGDQS